MTKPSPISRVVPSLVVADGRAALEFYVDAFGAVETMRLEDPSDGRIGHAELSFGDSLVYLADEHPDVGILSPANIGGSPLTMHLTVGDADAFIEYAERCGARVLRPAQDEFYGDRRGILEDPFGYRWSVSHPLEDMSAEDMQAAYPVD